MRHMAKVRVAMMVVLIGLSGAGLVFGQDSNPCYEAYLESGLTAQQMTFDEFRGVYGETVCATQVARPAEAASPGTNGKVAFASNRDGDFEVFTTNPDGNDEVYSMFATGTSQSNVSRAPSADSGPSWQPLPTTYTVNFIQDSADFNVGDGRCFAR